VKVDDEGYAPESAATEERQDMEGEVRIENVHICADTSTRTPEPKELQTHVLCRRYEETVWCPRRARGTETQFGRLDTGCSERAAELLDVAAESARIPRKFIETYHQDAQYSYLLVERSVLEHLRSSLR
jgi:hypothetical protein